MPELAKAQCADVIVKEHNSGEYCVFKREMVRCAKGVDCDVAVLKLD